MISILCQPISDLQEFVIEEHWTSFNFAELNDTAVVVLSRSLDSTVNSDVLSDVIFLSFFIPVLYSSKIVVLRALLLELHGSSVEVMLEEACDLTWAEAGEDCFVRSCLWVGDLEDDLIIKRNLTVLSFIERHVDLFAGEVGILTEIRRWLVHLTLVQFHISRSHTVLEGILVQCFLSRHPRVLKCLVNVKPLLKIDAEQVVNKITELGVKEILLADVSRVRLPEEIVLVIYDQSEAGVRLLCAAPGVVVFLNSKE